MIIGKPLIFTQAHNSQGRGNRSFARAKYCSDSQDLCMVPNPGGEEWGKSIQYDFNFIGQSKHWKTSL